MLYTLKFLNKLPGYLKTVLIICILIGLTLNIISKLGLLEYQNRLVALQLLLESTRILSCIKVVAALGFPTRPWKSLRSLNQMRRQLSNGWKPLKYGCSATILQP